MGKLTKNQKLAAAKIDTAKSYPLTEAVDLLKEITFTKEGCSPAEEFFAGETRISRSEAVAQRLGKLSYE